MMETVQYLGEPDSLQRNFSQSKIFAPKDHSIHLKKSESESKITLDPFNSYTEPDIPTEPCKPPHIYNLFSENKSLENINQNPVSLDFLDEKKSGKGSIKHSEESDESLSPQQRVNSFKRSTKPHFFTEIVTPKQQQDNEGRSLSPIKHTSCTTMNSKRLEKSGYLYKKTTSFFFKWQKQYYVVRPSKIYFAPTQEAYENQVGVKCINLKTQTVRVLNHHGIEFTIGIEGITTPVCLRAGSLLEAEQWVSTFQRVFSEIEKDNIHTNVYIHSPEHLLRSDLLSEKEFLEEADTGDILLYQSNHFGAKVQRLFTASDYDHISVLIRAGDDIYIFDSVYEQGVQLTNWKDFKETKGYLGYSGIIYRKLRIPNKVLENQIKANLWEFMTQQLGKKYELNVWKLFKRASILELDEEDFDDNTPIKKLTVQTNSETHTPVKKEESSKHPPKTTPSTYRDSNEGFFCSELVAATFKYVGLLDSTTSSSKYLPVSFSHKKGLGLLKGASFSCEYGLALIDESKVQNL